MSLKGSPDLRARLKAIRQSFKPIGKTWAESTAKSARRRVPVKTGRLMRSIRVRNATQRRATVVGHFSGNFVNAGTKPHDEQPKNASVLAYGSKGQTRFSRRVHHPRTQAHPFKVAAARDGLRENPMAEVVIRQWNEAVR